MGLFAGYTPMIDGLPIGLLPAFVLGTPHLYIIATAPAMWELFYQDFFINPTVTAGASFGERVKVLFEIGMSVNS